MLFTKEKKLIEFFLMQQKVISFGKYVKEYENIPRLIHTVLEKILEIKENEDMSAESILKVLLREESLSKSKLSQLLEIKVNA